MTAYARQSLTRFDRAARTTRSARFWRALAIRLRCAAGEAYLDGSHENAKRYADRADLADANAVRAARLEAL